MSMTLTRRKAFLLALQIGTPILVVVLWYVLSQNSTSFYFPPLSRMLDSFKDNWLFSRFSSDVIPSLVRLVLGYLISVAVAVPVGVLLGLSPTARRATSPIVEFLRAIPAPALIPFGIVVMGIGNTMKIFIIVMVCVWPIMLNTIDGIRAVDPQLVDTARAFRTGTWDRLRSIVLPAAMPQIFAGMRTSLSLAVILMVISEMVASTNGIGYFVLQSQRTFAIPDMWSGIILLGLLGFGLNVLFGVVEARALAWHRGARSAAR
jgi:ABC-type nitrate/sulfonate/bicarbonate transport system permease component